MKHTVNLILVITLLAGENSTLYSYDVETHESLARRAAEVTVSSLERTLKGELGFTDGIGQTFPNSTVPHRNVQELIGDGARFEDEPFWRVVNHFHNPLQPWSQAGLLGTGQSSVLWGQDSDQKNFFPLIGSGGSWSWQDARRRYVEAVTALRKSDRDNIFAELFRNLGQLTHLVQDATVPAHVRNDPHPSIPFFFGISIPVNPDWYEQWAETNRSTVRNFITLDPINPPFSIFRPTNDNQAPVPVARLIDNDKLEGGNFSILSDLDIGVAEYTNGNFLSRNRKFGSFTLPRVESLDLDNPILVPVDLRWRRYYSKVREGAKVNHFVAEGMLFRSMRSALLAPPPSGGWILDDRVQEDYGRLLLPRAVGYSAGLLDYFFRGKLDVELFPDPNNPSVLELKGTNGSPEALVDGTLALYSDGPDGTRTAVPALNPLNVANIQPGQELSSRFEVSQEAERFIAVYKGTLGNEVQDPANNFPGAVIGKVLGGVRVEQVFSDGTRWHLRTPKGIFPLPILVSDVVDLRWGDRENTLVGRSQIGPNQPNLFYSFEVKREPESLDLVLRAPEVPMPDQPPGAQVVDLVSNNPLGFPLGISSGTTVNLSQTIDYKNVAISVIRTETQTWDGPNNNTGQYRLTSAQFSDPRVHTFHTGTQTMQRSFAVTFDLNTFCSAFGPPYCWFLQDIFLNAQGDILALVAARPVFINQFAEFPYFRLTVPPGGNGNDDLAVVFDDFAIYFLAYPTNMGPILWALVNISKQEIVASTAPPEVTLHHRTSESEFNSLPNTFSNVFQKTLLIGGPQDGQFKYTAPPTGCTQEQRNQMQFIQMSEPILEFGSREPTINQYRPEIAQHQLPLTAGVQQTTSRHFITCGDLQLGIPSTGFEVTRKTHQYRATQVAKISRRLSESGADSAIFLMEAFDPFPKVSGSSQSKLIRWAPGQNEATLRREFSEPGFLGEHSLRSVSDGAVLVRSTFNPSVGGPGRFTVLSLVPLEGGVEPVALEVLNPTDLIVLNPKFLYHVRDLKFYSQENSPRATALPATLATGGAISFNDFHYHTVRVP